MKTVELTCIACPKGCRMQVMMENGEVTVLGSGCTRGKGYAKNEILNPVRMVTTILKTRRAGQSLLSVRTTSPVPKEKVPEVLYELHRMKVKAPIAIGDVVCRNVAGTHIDVIATKAIPKALWANRFNMPFMKQMRREDRTRRV